MVLDRLQWQGHVAFSCYGARIGIRTNRAAELDEICRQLPPCHELTAWDRLDAVYSLWIAPARVDRRTWHRLYAGGERIARDSDRLIVLRELQSALHFKVALEARGRLFVHAAVVGAGGRAIVIPGRTQSGKTSLAAALVRAGASYYSDEYAVFDEDGRIHPYPKLLSMRTAGAGPPNLVSADQIGGATGSAPLTLGLIVVTHYDPRAEWCPTSMSRAAGLMALLDNTIAIRERPEFALPVLRKAVEWANAITSPRPDGGRTARLILERCAAS